MNHISIISLIGGFSIAAEQIFQTPPQAVISYTPFYANDSLYLNYLKQRGYDIPYYQLDKLNNYDIFKQYKDIDIVTSIPPCSGISSASSLKCNKAEAPANEWMIRSSEFSLQHIKPKIHVFENAPGLYSNICEPVRQRLITIASTYNYGITFYKTNTLLHGIPQKRIRTYVIFSKNTNAPILHYINKEMIPLSEYLKQILKEASLQDSYFTDNPKFGEYETIKWLQNELGADWRNIMLEHKDHIYTYNYLVDTGLIYKFKKWAENHEFIDPKILACVNHVIKKTEAGKNFRSSYQSICLDKNYTNTVIGGMMSCNAHPTEDRILNIREIMTLMGLPYDFELKNKQEWAKIPQNVPRQTSEDIIKECVAIIEGNRKFHTDKVLMIDNTKPNIALKAMNLF
ncbi:MAG: DNA cytosine methyltransferase [Clostridia bacterium]